MKTLKKILSLVLVVAMLASMMIVGAAAAEEKTNYEEAVAVVTGIGIIEGDENGMNYQGLVTREQAAKIIAYLLLGKTGAEKLTTTTAPFADVAASRWSAGYIAYLKGQGIISGVSDTEFDPTANVTGIAFAKMLLSAAGYGKAGEFEGAAWDINTITFANDNGVFTGTLAEDVADPATREEAMLYAFNVLTKVPVVKYNKTFESYYVGPSALDTVDGTFDPTDPEADNNPYAYTLGYTKYELSQSASGNDDFGRPCMSWEADGVIVADEVAVAVPDAVLTGTVNSGSIYTAIGKAAADNFNKEGSTSEINVYVDGVKQDGTYGKTAVVTAPVKAGYTTNAVSSYGATVEIYVNYKGSNKYVIDIVVWYEHTADVTKVSKSANTITLDGSIVVSGEDFDISGYAKNDVVIYTMGTNNGNDEIATIRVAEPVVGTFINYTTFIYNIDGVSYYANAKAESTPTDYNTSYEIYFDYLGTILRADAYDSAAASGSYQYLYVQSVESQIATDNILTGNDSSIVMEVVYAAGGKEVVDYQIKTEADGDEYITFDGSKVLLYADTKTNTNGTYKVADEDGNVHAGITANTWYSYTANEAGEVTLKTLTGNSYATVKAAIAVDTGEADTGTGFAANSKTVLTIIDDNGVAVTYTGISTFPEEFEGSYSVLVTHAKTGTKNDDLAKTIVVYVEDDYFTTNTEYMYVFMAYSFDDETVTYMAYKDGAMAFIPVSVDNLDGVNAGTMYTVCTVAQENGEYIVGYADEAVNNGLFIYDANTSAQTWFEEATIDSLDENFFTTVEVDVDGYQALVDTLVDVPEGVNKTEVTDETTEYLYFVDPMDNTSEMVVWSNNGTPSNFYDDYLVYTNQDAIDAANEANADTEAAIAALMVDTVCGYNVGANRWYYNNDTVIYDCTAGGVVVDELSEGDCFVAVMDDDDADLCAYIWIVG